MKKVAGTLKIDQAQYRELEAFTNGDWKESMKMCADYLLNSDFVKPSYSAE